jgi:hypothetical protein
MKKVPYYRTRVARLPLIGQRVAQNWWSDVDKTSFAIMDFAFHITSAGMKPHKIRQKVKENDGGYGRL